MNTICLDPMKAPTPDVVARPCAARRHGFLKPDDTDWTDDGAGNWVVGHVGGLTYSMSPAGSHSHVTLHNRGQSDLAVLSLPGFTGTAHTAFTLLPRGGRAVLPDNEFHLIEAERRDGCPVLVGQIVDDGQPSILLHPRQPRDVDWSHMVGADEFWTPATSPASGRRGIGDYPASTTGDAYPIEVHSTPATGMTVVHNRGHRRMAVLMTGVGGAYDLVVAWPGESVPIPPGPGIHYVQLAPDDAHAASGSRPIVVDVIRIEAGRSGGR